MAQPSNTNSMEFKDKEIEGFKKRRAVLCIAIGTAAGLAVYGIFLYFHIDIYGWNLGLIFAPLAAGYVETIIANRIIGENIGAISAFILFIDTTFYSFILKNPTLGWNLITAGSIIVILQAAFPTLINYILLVVTGGIVSHFVNRLKSIERKIYYKIRNQDTVRWETPSNRNFEKFAPVYDEKASNEKINGLNFFFITSTDLVDRKHENLGQFNSNVIIGKDKKIIHANPKEAEKATLYDLKKGKDECLIKLSEEIKSAGGNAVVDLNIQYGLIGLGGDSFRINAMGMGVKLML